MLIYRPDNFFFQKVHPIALVSYIVTLFIIIIASDHPILLAFTVFTILLSGISVGGSEDIRRGLGLVLKMTLFLILVNCLTNKNGRTIIWRVPNIPIFGSIQISIEAFIYALVMGVRLLGTYALFIFYNKAISPDAALSYMSILFPKSALLVAMTTKTIPHLAQLSRRVGQVMYVMGLDAEDDGYMERIKKRIPILKVLLMSSIEDSLSIAESIQARGYGTGRRSRYFKRRWRVRDILIMLTSICSIISFTVLKITNGASYNFYPKLDSLLGSIDHMGMFIAVIISIAIPVVIERGWRHCRYIKYKI